MVDEKRRIAVATAALIVDVVVSDTGLSAEHQDELRAHDIDVRLA